MSEQTIEQNENYKKYAKAARSMYITDSILLCLTQIVLIIVILAVLIVVFALASDLTVKALAVAACAILIIASTVALYAVIKHLAENYLEVNTKDLMQIDFLCESRGKNKNER